MQSWLRKPWYVPYFPNDLDTCRAPTVFWGRHGGQGRSSGDNPRTTALILMGDWCGLVPTPQERKPGRERRADARSGFAHECIAAASREVFLTCWQGPA